MTPGMVHTEKTRQKMCDSQQRLRRRQALCRFHQIDERIFKCAQDLLAGGTWTINAELELAQRLQGVAETFAEDARRPNLQEF